MADIRPFKAIRPDVKWVEEIASLPYDVYSRKEAYDLTRGDEHSFLRIDRPETQFEPDYDMYSDEVYRKASEMLRTQIATGEFVEEAVPAFYIYAQTMNGRVQTGIVALSSVQDYVDGVIKKHENTRADKEADRIRHVDTCNAQTGPIFLAYRQSDAIREVINKIKSNDPPVYDFIKNDVRQQVWIIDDTKDIDIIASTFGGMNAIYIADGHHRCASACRVALNRRNDINIPENSEAEHFLSVLFTDEELMIMDYNRVLKTLAGLTEEQFLTEVSKVYSVELIGASGCDLDQVRPVSKGQCSLYLGNKWYRLTYDLAKLSGDPVADLDVSILQDNILGPILGIIDPKTDKNIDFVGGIRGLAELERRCTEDCVAAFAMYPTDIHELFEVADAGLLMPPKSTWFEPKLLSGLFIHDISDGKE